ncbi:hypothetical protein F5Y19DRAFT_34001 [Xylariaceae sp. FL1651]|nr:hypothetical protein F5Y19DRAFT_34001 [Xylariaceae sp. FL1651]
MRLRNILLAAAIPSVTALHQRVVAHPTSTVELTPPNLRVLEVDTSNTTEIIAEALPPLTTVVADKPAVEASIMGLIVFSAAGLVLL